MRTYSVLTLFGTRPEVIKLAPVLHVLNDTPEVRSVAVSSGQHTELLQPFIALFKIVVAHDLALMQPDQTPAQFLARALTALEGVLGKELPEVVLVQGDTTTALAGALASFHRCIPVGHVEAGLRSGDPLNPFPEEINRRLISRLATWHFAATPRNRDTLLSEGVAPQRVFLTGNPVVDALNTILEVDAVSPLLAGILEQTHSKKRIMLTTHRRESFGAVMAGNLTVLRDFVAAHEDVALVFPVHPNPNVRRVASNLLEGCPRTYLLPPLDYPDFIGLMRQSWLIVSDSGGVQEEAASLGVPLLVPRKNTERPEAVECGSARLVHTPEALRVSLEDTYQERAERPAQPVANPFGAGDSGRRIVAALLQALQDSTIPGEPA
jgi:UDP-N-acetylglucosamine 2-epimerase (non-hydrolysing)